ncbi:hypothetical protein IVB30_41440 [Bradyrhizobium sp. 200]|nr:hypothetical protein IVB30_41440 [Bradyrhizobium sp. 200]
MRFLRCHERGHDRRRHRPCERDNTIHRYYDDPANSGLSYETAEGGWQGQTWWTYEIFDELGLDFPLDEGDRLHNTIASGVGNDLWSEAEPYALSPVQQLAFSWERFCKTVKHERRYFFLHEEKKRPWPDHDELYSPAEILRAIFSFAEHASAFGRMRAGTALFRAPAAEGKAIRDARLARAAARRSRDQDEPNEPPGRRDDLRRGGPRYGPRRDGGRSRYLRDRRVHERSGIADPRSHAVA